MTKQEFDRTKWYKGMMITYEGLLYPVAGVNFSCYEIQVYDKDGNDSILCEACEIVKEESK